MLNGGRRVVTFSIEERQAQMLDAMEKSTRSKYIRGLLDLHLTVNQFEELDVAIRKKDLDILQLKGLLLQAETDKATLEQRRTEITRKKEKSMEKRLKYLETGQLDRPDKYLQAFLENRHDILQELDFETPEACVAWRNEMRAKMTR